MEKKVQAIHNPDENSLVLTDGKRVEIVVKRASGQEEGHLGVHIYDSEGEISGSLTYTSSEIVEVFREIVEMLME